MVVMAVIVVGSEALKASESSPVIGDFVPGPPLVEVIASPSGNFRLEFHASQDAALLRATGVLFAVEGEESRKLWQRLLPQEIRPRFALVSDQGTVLLFDEWINKISPMAIVLLDRTGEIVAQRSFDDIALALGVKRSALPPKAKHGAWMSSKPRTTFDGSQVSVEAGGKTLVISWSDGALGIPP